MNFLITYVTKNCLHKEIKVEAADLETAKKAFNQWRVSRREQVLRIKNIVVLG